MIEEAVHIQFQSGGAARPHTQKGSEPSLLWNVGTVWFFPNLSLDVASVSRPGLSPERV
jgi:hypothetical protein